MTRQKLAQALTAAACRNVLSPAVGPARRTAAQLVLGFAPAALAVLPVAAALFVAALPVAAAAQDAPSLHVPPAEAGMSASVLEGAAGLYREVVERGDLVGAVLLVAKDGRIVLHEAVGWRDKARGLPMELNTMFRMASNTKPVVAAGVAMLVEDGKLGYDDLVREYMPSWDNYRAGFITVGHLLSHSSGLRIPTLFLRPYMRPTAEHPGAPTLQLEAARFGEVGAEAVPGATYSYNNPGYNTLGALVEIASGTLLDQYLDDALYTPLGMHDSYHHEMAEKLDGKLDRMSVVYYERDADGEWTPGWTPDDPPQVPFVRASGGMISTAPDYLRFCQMFLDGGEHGGVRLLSPETVALMTSPKIRTNPASDGPPAYYGYGWSVSPDGAYSHSGSDGTSAWIDPSRGLIVLVFTQTPGGRNPVGRFREMVKLAVEG